MEKIRVLFISVANSFRSQVAEAYMNATYGDRFEAESAGYQTTSVNPTAVELMRELDIDISLNKTAKVMDYFKEDRTYDYVVAVCQREEEASCPVYPGEAMKLVWKDLPNPELYEGTDDERFGNARNVVQNLIKRIDSFVTAIG